MRAHWDAAVNRTVPAVLTIASSVVVATLIIVSGMFLKWLLGVAVGTDTRTFGSATFVLDSIYVPCAVIWAVSGVAIVGWDAVVSIKSLFQQTR